MRGFKARGQTRWPVSLSTGDPPPNQRPSFPSEQTGTRGSAEQRHVSKVTELVPRKPDGPPEAVLSKAEVVTCRSAGWGVSVTHLLDHPFGAILILLRAPGEAGPSSLISPQQSEQVVGQQPSEDIRGLRGNRMGSGLFLAHLPRLTRGKLLPLRPFSHL